MAPQSLTPEFQQKLLDSLKAGEDLYMEADSDLINEIAKKHTSGPLHNLAHLKKNLVKYHLKTLTIPNEPLEAAVPLSGQDYYVLDALPPQDLFLQPAQHSEVYPLTNGLPLLDNIGAATAAGGGGSGGQHHGQQQQLRGAPEPLQYSGGWWSFLSGFVAGLASLAAGIILIFRPVFLVKLK
jgi:hypothetical protein